MLQLVFNMYICLSRLYNTFFFCCLSEFFYHKIDQHPRWFTTLTQINIRSGDEVLKYMESVFKRS